MVATSSLSKNSRPLSTGASNSFKQIIEAEVNTLIKTHFSATLGTINNITNLVLACIYKESTFRPYANSGIHGERQLKRFKEYSAISAKFNSKDTTEQEKTNMRNSVAGFGLMQTTGWYLTKGAGPGGKNELSRMRADLAGPLLLEPGENIDIKLGPSQITNQLLTGLIILEDKYKVAPSKVANPPTRDRPFTNRVSATFGGYLGHGVDKFNTNPNDYAASIIQGSSYQKAIGGFHIPGVNTGSLALGPTRTVASGTNPDSTGCCSS